MRLVCSECDGAFEDEAFCPFCGSVDIEDAEDGGAEFDDPALLPVEAAGGTDA